CVHDTVNRSQSRGIVSVSSAPSIAAEHSSQQQGASFMPRQASFVAMTLALVAVTTIAAESADDLKLPTGYRTWFHVNTMIVDKASPLFSDLGGMHNVYANTRAAAALKKGGTYPDGSQFVTDLHDFTITDGSYVEGTRKGVATMIK